MKIITEDGFKYNKKNLKMEGMVICRTNVTNLLIARKYVKPKETEQNRIFRNRIRITKIIWRMTSEEFKEDSTKYVKLLQRYSRKDREKLKHYNKYSVFYIILKNFFLKNTAELDNIKVLEDFFKLYGKLCIKDFVKNGVLRKVFGFEKLERRME